VATIVAKHQSRFCSGTVLTSRQIGIAGGRMTARPSEAVSTRAAHHPTKIILVAGQKRMLTLPIVPDWV